MTRRAAPGGWRPWAAALTAYLLAALAARVLEIPAAPITEMSATWTRAVLAWLDVPVIQSGALLYQAGGFSCLIAAECVGLSPVIALAAFLLADGSRSKSRAWRVFLSGALLLISLNLVRLVSLFWIGTQDATLFRVAHELIWPVLLIAAFLVILTARPVAGFQDRTGADLKSAPVLPQF